MVLEENGQLCTGGSRALIRQDPPTVSDGVSVFQVTFEVQGLSGRRFRFQGQIRTGGIIGRAIGNGEYEQEDGAQVGRWQISQLAAPPIVCHVHAPLGWVGGCWWVFHDPGCAGLPEETGCFLIQVGKNRGKYLCMH